MNENKNTSETLKRLSRGIWNWWWLASAVILLIGGVLDVSRFNNSAINTIAHIFSVALVTLGSVIITSGVGTFLLNKTGYVELLKNQLIEIMCQHSFIKTMKPDKLIELKKAINEEIYTRDLAYNEGSLLNTVSNSIDPFISKYYFERYSIEVTCKLKENYLEKTVQRDMFIKPAIDSDDNFLSLSDLFSTTFEPIDNEEAKMKLRDVRIEGENLTKYFEIICEESDENNHFIYKIGDKGNGHEKLKLKKKGLHIKIVVKYGTKKGDTLYVHKLPVACKDYTARLNYKDDQYNPQVGTFGFMDSQIKGKTTVDTQEDYIKVSFNDWILPGDGVAFSWNYV